MYDVCGNVHTAGQANKTVAFNGSVEFLCLNVRLRMRCINVTVIEVKIPKTII